MPISETYNMDVMEYLKGVESGFFDLAIADTPYGIGEDGRNNHTRGKAVKFGNKFAKGGSIVGSKDYRNNNKYDDAAPPKEFFKELRRVSKNQIIFGANHFISRLPYDSPAWVVWDKMNGDSDFADCELAWTSFKTAVRKFEYKWNGMLQGDMKNKEERIHPNHKPVALYKWLLQNYARPGDKIFDPMMGSQSSRIAAWDMGFDYVGCEKDADYFRDGEARFKKHVANKTTLFAPSEMYDFKQTKLEF